MAKVITVSTKYPPHHKEAGKPTYFVEKIYNSLDVITDDRVVQFKNTFKRNSYKHTTVRSGKRFKAGDYASLRIWGNDINIKSGRSGPYHSKQIILTKDVLIEKVFDFKIIDGLFFINSENFSNGIIIDILAENDGLTRQDFLSWFKYPNDFDGQIICWNKKVNYEKNFRFPVIPRARIAHTVKMLRCINGARRSLKT
jgi:hypothetical protein